MTITDSSAIVADTTAAVHLKGLQLRQLRKAIGMDNFFAISFEDFEINFQQLIKYRSWIIMAQSTMDSLRASNYDLKSAYTFSVNENNEMRIAFGECKNQNAEYIEIIAINKKTGRRQKYIWGFSGGAAGVVGGIILTAIILR